MAGYRGVLPEVEAVRAAVEADLGVTPMQRKLVQAFADGMTPREAAAKVGCSVRHAHRVLQLAKGDRHHDGIQRIMTARMSAAASAAVATASAKCDALWAIAGAKLDYLASHPEEVTPSIMMQALDMLNKLQGHYAPTATLSVNADMDLDASRAVLAELVERSRSDY